MATIMQLAIGRLTVYNNVAVRSFFNCKGFHRSSAMTSNAMTPNQAKTYGSVAEFYNGKSVFITGGTGFLGMTLVEKLLYTCTGIDKVYLLVREKKGVLPGQRVKQFINNPLFERLREDKPMLLNKLVPVSGDVGAPDLGISDDDVKTLSEEVSVVFHAAATVRFNDKLSVPLKYNFEGTRQMLELSKRMKNLEMFVHISTAYANVTDYNHVVKEMVYPPPATVEDVYDFVAKYDNDEEMTTKYLNGRLSTYTFAKALAEHHVATNKEHVPLIIVRPAAVTAMADGPVPGWLNDWQGATRFFHNVSMGHIRIVPGRRENVIDLIPVDYVSNLCIIAAAKSNAQKDQIIYNSCSSLLNPIKWSEGFRWFSEDVVRRGMNDLPYPFVAFVESEKLQSVLKALTQSLPSYMADMWLQLTGRQPKNVLMQRRTNALAKALACYLRYNSKMECQNVMKLIDSLTEKDRQLYPCNPARLDWRKYMHVYAQGVQKFLLDKTNKK